MEDEAQSRPNEAITQPLPSEHSSKEGSKPIEVDETSSSQASCSTTVPARKEPNPDREKEDEADKTKRRIAKEH